VKHYSKKVDEKQIEIMNEIRAKATELDNLIELKCPKGRYQSLAMTKLEECSMFAIKAITHN
jgi:hypothetical protein